MIRDKKPVTLAEVRELLKGSESDKAKNTIEFIKKFTKMNVSEANKLKQELIALDIAKLKEEDIVKIIDFMPEDAEDVRKIFSGSDISLEQDEITKILETLKKK
ncbi:MAG: hypothetical protein N3G19_01240 [Candidatus Pacearchaeota archaeon]|nr:hypothetical protein [Candidatus Pacearchaeota archaeon]